jgi:hypothetical protein
MPPQASGEAQHGLIFAFQTSAPKFEGFTLFLFAASAVEQACSGDC